MNRRHHRFSRLSLLLTLALVGGARLAVAAPEKLITPVVRKALGEIRPEGIRAHVRFLSDDLLEGRDTGSPGTFLAARYIAGRFEELGLKPAGDNGTFLQNVPLVRSRMDRERSRLEVRRNGTGNTLKYGDDFLLNGSARGEGVAEGPLVFAGFGITAPEFQHDDYRNIDVRGKLVVLLTGEPSSQDPAFFDGERDTRYASGNAKAELARSKGALGVITLLWGERGRRFSWQPAQGFQSQSSVRLPGGAGGSLPNVVVSERAAEALFAGTPVDWTEVRRQASGGTVRPVDLGAEAKLELAIADTPLPSPNVAGMVEGSDPVLRKQVVVYTAHYDHLGRRGSEGDTIYNGAWDNASGTAALLEIARAYASMKPAPRRSVLFLLVTGEEYGLLGSRHYVRQPLVPLSDTAANITMDMTDIFGVATEFVPLGVEYSSLKEACEAVAREHGLAIGKDPNPERNYFRRSDHFSFVEAGVPALFLRFATRFQGLDDQAARERSEEKMRSIYHKPADEFDPSWSWEGMRKHAQTAFLLGVYVANQPEMPRWNPGAEFDKPRGAK